MKRKHDSDEVVDATKQRKTACSYEYNLRKLVCDLIGANKDVAKLFFEKYIDNYMDILSLSASDVQILTFLKNTDACSFKQSHLISPILIWNTTKLIGSIALTSMTVSAFARVRRIPEVIDYLFKHNMRGSVRHSLQNDAKHKQVQHRLLINACQYDGWSNVVESVLKMKDADPARYNSLCLRLASRRGLTKVVKLLLDDGRVEPSVNDNEAFKLAYKNKHFEVAALLYPHLPKKLRDNPDPDNEYDRENYVGLCRALMQIKRE